MPLWVLTLLAALGSGLIAGVFFAFSSFVMGALGRLPAAQGVAAMQSINVVVLNRSFLGVFVGTALACGVIAFISLLRWSAPGATLRFAGAIAYLIGTFGVTMAFNVPRNDALEALRADTAEAAAFWGRYLVEWTRWNHVRTVGALAAAALFTLGLLKTGDGS
jgi:uncharacterized membrane protein